MGVFTVRKLTKIIEMYRFLGGGKPIETDGVSEGSELCLLCISSGSKDGFKQGFYYIGCDGYDKSIFYEVCTLKDYELYISGREKSFSSKHTKPEMFGYALIDSNDSVEIEKPLHKDFKWCRVPRKGDVVIANLRCSDSVYRPRKCRVLETGEKYDAYGEFVVVCIEKGSSEETAVQWIDEYVICDQ